MVFPCILMYSHVFSCIRMYSHVFACIRMYRDVSVMYQSCIGHMYRSCIGHVSVCILKYRIVLSCIATYRCVFWRRRLFHSGWEPDERRASQTNPVPWSSPLWLPLRTFLATTSLQARPTRPSEEWFHRLRRQHDLSRLAFETHGGDPTRT